MFNQSGRDFALHALDQKIHAQNLRIGQRLPGRDHHAPGVVPHRADGTKGMQAPGSDVALARQHEVLHGLGYFGTEAAHLDHALFHTAPDVAGFPAAI